MAQGNQSQKRNLAAEAFRRNYAVLHDALAQPDVARGLASKLYSGAIITLETRDAVLIPAFTPTQQTNWLLQAVESSIKIDHTWLRKFTRILRKQPVLVPIAKQLRQCYRELVSEARLTESSSSGSDAESTEQHQSQAAILMTEERRSQKTNLAAEAFRRNYVALHDALAQPDAASVLSIKLYSAAIITSETREVVQTPSFTPTQQTNYLLQAVESSIKIDHTRLQKFTRILRKQPVLVPIAKQLRQCYRELVSEARLTESSSSGTDTESTEQHQSQEGSVPEICYSDLEFKDQLGEGAFGVVYRGHWMSRDMDVAIKRVPGKINKTEIEILSKLSHLCIIQFHGVVVDRPGPPEQYIVTELAEGGSLYDLLHKKNYQPSQKESLRWASQIAQGMKYLHHKKMMHRDLKSSNVLLTGEGNIKICDFGGAKDFDHTTMRSQTGTYRWMAPEVMQGEPVSLSSDVFSYGMLLYEIFTGKLPFADVKTDVMVSNKIINGEIPPLPDSIESYLAKTLKQCWNANPKARPRFHDILEILKNKGISPSVMDTAGGHFPSLYELNEIPGMTTIWYKLGLQLGVRADDLDMIEKSNADACMIKMFAKWQGGDTNPTYKKLVRGLAAVGERELAESVCSAQGISPSVLDTLETITVFEEGERAIEVLQEQIEEMEITEPQTDPAEYIGGAMPLKEVKEKPYQCIVKSQGETTENVKTTEYLRGVEAIAETQFIVKGRHSQTFKWEGHGLKLSIPEGALLSDSVIYIKAGLAGHFDLPSGGQLVSPVYWLYCDNNFQHPVTLELQHCAIIKHQSECSSLSFIVAKCSQKELPYKFKILDKGTFSQHSSYGSVNVKQFSVFGVIMQWLLPRSYSAQFFYSDKGENIWQLDFIITWNQELCRTFIQQLQNYSNSAVEGGPHTELQFEEESISLPIQEDGISKNGWAITRLNPPMITKQQVDSCKPGQRIPSCQLQVRLVTTDSPEILNYELALEGAKQPNFLTINRIPVHGRPRQSEGDQSDGIQAPTLEELLDNVKTTEWFHLGLKLGIKQEALAVIQSNKKLDASGALMKVLQKWLQVCEGPTWVAMVAALREIGEGSLAKKLEDKFC